MYGYNTNDLSGDFLGHLPVPDYTTPSTFPSPSLAPFPPNSLVIPNNELESLSAVVMNQEFCYATNYSNSTSSGCSSYGSPSSLTSYGTQTSSYMQRSVSSQSLHKNVKGFQFHQATELLDPDSGPVRKAFSTGDLERIYMVQQYNHQSEISPLSSESSNIHIIEGINSKACRYSPEEKKERIERYRSKRNQRNFNKKIKYVCRKTLADSRPRIRGRFARNKDENEKVEAPPHKEWNQMSGIGGDEDLDHDYDENWINVLNAFSVNLIP